MAAKKVDGIPRTAKAAKKRGHKKVKKVELTEKEKQKWAYFRPGTATRSHTICYYDPNTGLYDDCYEV